MISCSEMILSNKDIEAIRKKASLLGENVVDVIVHETNSRALKIMNRLLPDSYKYVGYTKEKNWDTNDVWFSREQKVLMGNNEWLVREKVRVYCFLSTSNLRNVIEYMGKIEAKLLSGAVIVNATMCSDAGEEVEVSYMYGYGTNDSVDISDCTTLDAVDLVIMWLADKDNFTDNERYDSISFRDINTVVKFVKKSEGELDDKVTMKLKP